jgi:hypothetical protein
MQKRLGFACEQSMNAIVINPRRITMTTQLSPSQQLILNLAAQTTDGKLDWFPDTLKGGARKKVLDSMVNRALITRLGGDWFVTAEGYDALGLPHRAPITLDALDTVITQAEMAQHGASQVLLDEIGDDDPTDAEIEASNDIDPEIEDIVTAIETKAHAEAKTPRTRENSKQATVIAMLKRPEGATIAQIMESTGWQAHTVRGTFAGAFKKKLGLDITSAKGDGDRVYRIAG